MKKHSKILCVILSLLMAVSVVTVAGCSCGGSGKGDVVDGKARLCIYSFTSGYGQEWLEELIKDYEEANKDKVFLEGTKGIKIEPTCSASDVDGSQMAGRDEVIYFLEQQDYYSLTSNGYLSDITDAITGTNPYESGKTLESKMFDDQKNYFKRSDGNYYAYPHYFTSFGITYDVELFDEQGYYLKKSYDPSASIDTWFTKSASLKSAGPDKVLGTDDDGLPTTYTEFIALCDYIDSCGDNPLLWSGQYRNYYLTHLVNALATQNEGYDQMRLNFTFTGEATTLGSIDSNGNFVKDETSTELDGSNGYEVARQAGKYYAMQLLQTFIGLGSGDSRTGCKSYMKGNKANMTLYSSTYSHLDAQDDFTAEDGSETKMGKKSAMLVDGSWWQAEATQESKASLTHKYGYMPLPKYDGLENDGVTTMYDTMYPLLMVKKLDKTSWKYQAAIDFIQFANTDAELAKFTKITSCTKALKYELTDAQYNELSPYAQTYYNAYKKACDNNAIVFPYAKNDIFANNQQQFTELSKAGTAPMYESLALANTFYTVALANNITAAQYFRTLNNGMYGYYKSLENVWKKI